MRPDEENANPTESEFFRGEGHADAVTREGTQNVLDAGSGDGPVRVSIRFNTEERALSPEDAEAYMDSLRPHLEADRVEIKDLPEAGGRMPYVTIEDYGTSGLTGDPTEYGLVSEETGENDFYWFWRNRGRSGKRATQRGRWGVGKFAFPSASRVNAFWGYTRRESDSEELLMGQSVLQVHEHPESGERCSPIGYYAWTRSEDGLAMPLKLSDDQDQVEQFKNDFGLDREEPGFSLVIPYPDPDLTPEAVVQSAIRHYFYPILSGKLVVEVDHDENQRQITSETIRLTTEAIEWPDGQRTAEKLKSLFDLSDWSIGQEEDNLTTLGEAGQDGAPNWDEEKFGSNLESLQDRYEDGDRIALKVPLAVKPKDGEQTMSAFRVYLEADEDLSGSVEHYIREGLTIPGISKVSRKGVRGLVVVEDDALSSLLGDSENPAHTYWNEKNEDVKDYKHGTTTVRYVVQSLNKITGFLSRPSEGTDPDILNDIFYLSDENHPSEDDDSSEAGEGNGENGSSGDDEEIGSSNENGENEGSGDREPFQITGTDNGFTVSSRKEVPTPDRARVEVAYVTERGNPFKQYDPRDFSLEDPQFDWSQSGAFPVTPSNNVFEVNITGEEFSVTVNGFDMHRDITVRADPVQAETSED
jgi:hypothetical protein